MTTTPITIAPPDAGGTGGAPRGAPPGAPPTSFEQVLGEQEQAWTAGAGGQHSQQPADDQPAQGGDAAVDALMALVAPASAEPAPATAAGAASAQAAMAALPGEPAASTATATTAVTAPPTTLAAGAAPTGVAVESASHGDAVATAIPTAAAPGANAGAGVAPDGTPLPSDAAANAAAPGSGAVGAGGRGPSAGAPSMPAAAPAASPSADLPATPVGSASHGDATSTATTPGEAAPAPAARAAATAVGSASHGDASSTAAAPGAAPTAPPVEARHDGATVHAPEPVPASQAPEALRDLIQLARTREANHARLVLHPNDLGGVEVRLRQTAEGIEATVHVEHPEALGVLQRGLGDLQRSLEARGVTLTSVDLGLAGEQGQPERRPEAGAGGPAGGSRGFVAFDEDDADGEHLSTTTTPTSVRLSAGAVVDVMA